MDLLISHLFKKGGIKKGNFLAKSGMTLTYFLNLNVFSDGYSIDMLSDVYADNILNSGVDFDVVFGSSYKGIPLCVAIVQKIFQKTGESKEFSYDRKEKKDHGDGGIICGADLKGKKVIFVDDVLTLGVSIRQFLALMKGQDASPVAAWVIVDRQEIQPGTVVTVSECVKKEIKFFSLFSKKDIEQLGYLD